MKLLIDGDVVRYRCGFAAQKTRYEVWTEDEQLIERCDNAADAKALMEDWDGDTHRVAVLEIEPVENALHSVKLMMQSMQDKWPEADMKVYFSCRTPDNWRTALYPQYKANRPDRRPQHDAAIRDYMLKKYSCQTGETTEADDLIAMEAARSESYIICSIDKDLKQIGGPFYDFTKDELTDVSPVEAGKMLELQKITGDSVDNIPGIAGWGPKKAEKWLADPSHTARDAYVNVFQDFDVAWYQYCLNSALVTLPSTEEELAFLIHEVEDARKEVEAVQEAGVDVGADVGGAGVGEADTAEVKASC